METTPEGVFRIQVKKLFGNAAGVLVVSTLLASCSRSDSNPAVVSGTIDTDEVHVASRYGGRVEKILAQEGDTLKAGQVIAELDAAELKARRDQAPAQLAEIETQLSEMRIVAPTDSVLEVLTVKAGDVLAPNREVATLLLPQHLWVRVYVPEPWLGHLKPGERVKVKVDSFPNKEF